MSRSKLRLILWRWHRRIGLFSALFVLHLSVTGLMLNHTETVGLDRVPLRVSLLLSHYGVKEPALVSYRLNSDWVSHLGSDYLFLNTHELAYCSGGLSGAVVHSGLWVVACGQELLLFTSQAELVERIGAHHGLPQPLERLGKCGGQLCLQSGSKVYQVDIDQLSWQPYHKPVRWARAEDVPTDIRRGLMDNYMGREITWERVMLDLHSGRLWGKWGPLFTDVIALFFIVLASSGVVMWMSGRWRAR
ncbi:MAG: PepSY domain-containing protein [Exilibacterium sp.]